MGAALIDFPSHHVGEEESPVYDASPPVRAHLTMVHDDVLDTIGEKLGAAALAVYVALERRANRAGICDPSYDTIAAALSLSRRHVIDQVKRLKEAGFVTVEQRRRSDQAHLSNVFHLPRHPNLIPLTPSEYSALPPSETAANNGRSLVNGVHSPSERGSESGALPSEHPSEDPSAPHAPKVDTSNNQVARTKEIPAAPEPAPEKSKTTSMPFLLFAAMCEEQGVDPSAVDTGNRSKQMAVTKRLADSGMTEDDMRRFVRWASGWANGMDAFFVEKQRTRWQMAGSPGEPDKKPAAKPLPYNHPRNAKGIV
jgi:hypothetical protein